MLFVIADAAIPAGQMLCGPEPDDGCDLTPEEYMNRPGMRDA